MKSKPLYITTILFVLVGLCSCKTPAKDPLSVSGMYYDTLVNIDIYGAGENASVICEHCKDLCSHYEDLFDAKIPESDIYRINHSHGEKVKVDHDTAVMLSVALDCCTASNGIFDITIAPVSSLWDFHEEDPHIPSSEDLQKNLTKVDYKKVSVDLTEDTVSVGVDTTLDAGATAKGYIADRIGDYLLSCDITGAIINIGGDIRVIGTKNDKKHFRIGINDPFHEDYVLTALELSDISVATSGIYERCFTVNGRDYHHIIDVKTGYPADTDIESVTVITKSAAEADSLCTVSILYGSEKAIRYIESIPDTEAVILLTDGTVIKTSGADRFIVK